MGQRASAHLAYGFAVRHEDLDTTRLAERYRETFHESLEEASEETLYALVRERWPRLSLAMYGDAEFATYVVYAKDSDRACGWTSKLLKDGLPSLPDTETCSQLGDAAVAFARPTETIGWILTAAFG